MVAVFTLCLDLVLHCLFCYLFLFPPGPHSLVFVIRVCSACGAYLVCLFSCCRVYGRADRYVPWCRASRRLLACIVVASVVSSRVICHLCLYFPSLCTCGKDQGYWLWFGIWNMFVLPCHDKNRLCRLGKEQNMCSHHAKESGYCICLMWYLKYVSTPWPGSRIVGLAF